MRETIVVITDGDFYKGEKVTAFNWFEKEFPFRTGIYIKHFSEEDVLNDDEECRCINNLHTKDYNIGQYKVMQKMSNLVKIAVWQKDDK